jgi:uncharacterized protein YbjT (DUF2867 family)
MILITGSTGKTGGEVARRLAAKSIPFRALIRNPDKAGPIEALGAEVVIGDIADQAALKRALDGVEKAFLVMSNDEEQLILEKQFTDAAIAAGVQHLVYLSSLESVPESKNPITQNHVAAETYIRESGLAWTMIRPTFFMQMFEGMAARIKETGKIVMPAGSGTVSTTDLRDVAEVIVDVLTNPGHENKSYDLTGPELLTFVEIAQQFSSVLGRTIEYVDQPMDEFRTVLKRINLSEWRTDAVCKELEAIGAGAVDHTTETLQELLGRPPTSLEQFIRDHEPLFR